MEYIYRIFIELCIADRVDEVVQSRRTIYILRFRVM